MMGWRRYVRGLALILLLATPAAAQRTRDWLPVTPEELAMKQNPMGGAAHAIVLFREDYTDDIESYNFNYFRIKILSEEGKKHADIEIAYLKGEIGVSDISARTIRPDGTIIPFKGQIFDKMIVKRRGVKVQARTFTLPDVQVGSIIEYRYTLRWDQSRLLSTFWGLQSELPTRRARFALKPYKEQFNLNWINFRVPPGKAAAEDKTGHIVLELENVPALEQEDFSPPERELQMRVEFFYTRERIEEPAKFWKQQGKDWNDIVEQFIGRRGGIERAAAEVTAGASAPEEKLRRIYDRVQHVRNLSFEREKSEQEQKREKIKDNNHIEDVWKNGYGYRGQINRLFIGLARGAGFEASAVRISERDAYFFKPNLQDERQLDGEIAVVKLNGEDRYYDPGTPFCPFGLLAWEKTGVQGIRLDKQGGSFITTPQPQPADALYQRTATLKLTPEGALIGKVKLSYVGYPGQSKKRAAMRLDEAGRTKDLEDDIKDDLPASAVVKITSTSGWADSNAPLVVEYDLELPGFAAATGRRVLLTSGVFQVGERHPFQHERRKYPVYLPFPFRESDDVTIELPAGLAVESVTPLTRVAEMFGNYEMMRANNGRTLQFKRRFSMDGYFINTDYYAGLRQYYVKVRAGDEEQAVLRVAPTGGGQD